MDERGLLERITVSRVLLTLDKDFGELTVGRRNPHSGIVRLVGFRAIDQAAALITVEPGRVRIRPKEDDWP